MKWIGVRRCSVACRSRPGAGANLSVPPDQSRRHRRGRRRHRRGGARLRPEAHRGVGPAGHRREQRRRGACHRRHRRRASRRPTATPCWWPRPAPSHQSGDLSQGQADLRREDRLHPDHRPRPHQPGAAGQQDAAGLERQGADRACQAEAGRTHLRHGRRRLRAAHEHRAPGIHVGRQACAGALSRRRARADRPDGRPHQRDVGQRQPGAAAGPGGPDQDSRHRQRKAAVARSPTFRPSPKPACRATRRPLGSACSLRPARRAMW